MNINTIKFGMGQVTHLVLGDMPQLLREGINIGLQMLIIGVLAHPYSILI
jgi:hypothetical protein